MGLGVGYPPSLEELYRQMSSSPAFARMMQTQDRKDGGSSDPRSWLQARERVHGLNIPPLPQMAVPPQQMPSQAFSALGAPAAPPPQMPSQAPMPMGLPPMPQAQNRASGGFLSGLIPPGDEFGERLGDMLLGMGTGANINDSFAQGGRSLMAGRQARRGERKAEAELNRTRQYAMQQGMPPDVAMTLDAPSIMKWVLDRNKPSEPIVIGGRLVDPKTFKPLYESPPEPMSEDARADNAFEREKFEFEKSKPADSFTLSPGQQRFDPSGRPLAGVPAEPKEPKFVTLVSKDGKERRTFDLSDPRSVAVAQHYAGQLGWMPADDLPEAPKPPPMEEIYDETTGQPYKGQWNPATGKYDRIGGTKAPAGTRLVFNKETGEFTFEQGSGLKPLTESQSKDTGFAVRAEGASVNLDQYETALTSLPESTGGSVPIVGNYLKSDEYQMAQQAGNEFLTALLRKDSGATITPMEQSSYGNIFLPQPGDGKPVMAQKKAARARAIAGINAGLPPSAILAKEQALKSLPPTSPLPTQGGGEEWTIDENGEAVRVK